MPLEISVSTLQWLDRGAGSMTRLAGSVAIDRRFRGGDRAGKPARNLHHV